MNTALQIKEKRLADNRRVFEFGTTMLQISTGLMIFLSGALSINFSTALASQITAGADSMTTELLGTGAGIAVAMVFIRFMISIWKKDRLRIKELEDERYSEAIKERDLWRDRAMENRDK